MSRLFPSDPSTAALSAADHCWLMQPHLKRCREILERDGGRCTDCRIAIPGYMEIHHKNHDHRDFSPENLVPICPFCHRIRHPVRADGLASEPEVELIWWPRISKGQLTNLAWCLFYFHHKEEQVEEVDDRRLVHGVSSPVIDQLVGEIREELQGRNRQALKIIDNLSIATLFETAWRLEEDPGEWEGLRLFPAGIMMPTRRTSTLSWPTPVAEPISFPDPQAPYQKEGINGYRIVRLLSPPEGLDILALGQANLRAQPYFPGSEA
ncbi:MAG: HNH endonuclease signature motif containing protein [Paracoccaceae bacterium]|nr:HNH endonuclease signature motif containing protein [Paracoccaceae bacterium]